MIDFSDPTTAKGTRLCYLLVSHVSPKAAGTYLDLTVQGSFLVVKLLVIVRVHLEVVESKLLLDSLLEGLSLLDSQGISLGNDGNNVDDIGKLLQDDDVDGLKRVA